MSEVLQIGSHGAIFELERPWTVDALRAGMTEAPLPSKLCRLAGLPWRHKRRVVGRTYQPEDDLFTTILALVAEGRSTKTLMRCERCGCVQVRSGP